MRITHTDETLEAFMSFLTKLIVKNKAGHIKKVRLKFDVKHDIESLRQFVNFPAGWEIAIVSHIDTSKLRRHHG